MTSFCSFFTPLLITSNTLFWMKAHFKMNTRYAGGKYRSKSSQLLFDPAHWISDFLHEKAWLKTQHGFSLKLNFWQWTPIIEQWKRKISSFDTWRTNQEKEHKDFGQVQVCLSPQRNCGQPWYWEDEADSKTALQEEEGCAQKVLPNRSQGQRDSGIIVQCSFSK